MMKQGCRVLLRVRREKKKRGNKYAEQLHRVRKTRIVEGTKTQSSWSE